MENLNLGLQKVFLPQIQLIIIKFIDNENRLLRPKNLFEPAPGKGFEIFVPKGSSVQLTALCDNNRDNKITESDDLLSLGSRVGEVQEAVTDIELTLESIKPPSESEGPGGPGAGGPGVAIIRVPDSVTVTAPTAGQRDTGGFRYVYFQPGSHPVSFS